MVSGGFFERTSDFSNHAQSRGSILVIQVTRRNLINWIFAFRSLSLVWLCLMKHSVLAEDLYLAQKLAISQDRDYIKFVLNVRLLLRFGLCSASRVLL
jgi:hypothetical protein